MLQLPQEVRIQILLDGVPISDMFASVWLDTGGPFPFTLEPGPSDPDGWLVLTHEDLRRAIEETWSTTPEWARRGHTLSELKEIRIRPRNRDALICSRVAAACERENIFYDSPTLRTAFERLEHHIGGVLEVRGSVTGWNGPVAWRSAPVEFPKTTTPPDGPLADFDRCLEAIRSRRWQDARRYFQEKVVAAADSGDRSSLAHLYQMWASLEFNAGDRDAARSLYAAAEEIEPTSAMLRMQHAHFLANCLHEPDLAEDKLREGERLASESEYGPPDYLRSSSYVGYGRLVERVIRQARARRS